MAMLNNQMVISLCQIGYTTIFFRRTVICHKNIVGFDGCGSTAWFPGSQAKIAGKRMFIMFLPEIWYLSEFHTVDGRNPAPVGNY